MFKIIDMISNKLLKQAFTLIELLVVIAIIGILSGLIVITMSGVTQKATIAKAQVFSNSLRNSLMMSLISEWKFDGTGIADGSAIDTTYTQDTWGTNPGVVGGVPKAYSGSNCINGSCILLDGVTDRVTHTDIHFADYAPHTVSIWVKWGTTPPSSYIAPYGRGWSGSSNVYFSKTLKVFAIRSVGSSTEQAIAGSNSTTVFDNNWHHVVWTVDSSRNAKFYLDGIQNGSVTVIATSTEMYYGSIGRGYNNNAYSWNGYIDELRVFSETLTSSQIKEQYYVGLNSLLASGGIAEGEYLEKIKAIATSKY
jgi:prepilin-type N-terminal cleavage/methylation domain-containing protein